MPGANIIPLFVIIPLFTAFFISLIGRFIKSTYVDIVSGLSSFLLLIFSFWGLAILGRCPETALVYKIGGWLPPFGICMVLDGLSNFMLVTVNIIAFLVVIYSFNYMEKYTDKPKFYTLFFLMLTGMNGVIVTGDLFNLFVFLEIASISSYALVAFGTEAEELEASFKYAIMGSVASAFIFIGIAFLYGFTSTLNMADMARVLSAKPSNWAVPFVSVLFLMGFGLKSALVPFHAWLPDAHSSAPASISAMLSGVLIKTLGVYALARIFFNVIGASGTVLSVLMFLGALSMLVAVILALSQWDLKRLLAYHSISQIGYVVLGIGLGTPLGILGGLFHLFNHSIFKSLLFLNSGAIDYSARTRDLREMSGLRKKLPVTAGTNLIASMSIAGIPPLNGFFSKLIIILACVQKGHIGYALAAVIASVLTLASFMKVQKFAFLGPLKEKYQAIKEVPPAMKFAMVSLATICILGGLLLLPSFSFFLNNAVNVLSDGRDYALAVFGAVLK
ncbi:MAG: NADH/ubiquinone/plastoquinone (complex I) [Candidatus Omnitrophica bacterium]|nr:NADH/ubiquinone/plastoquinone (complex I) [Candidatus Omnitrophota bacterium]MBL7210483.1 NADH/ubiquinone/plastoquinone (complex I) [Candidatus Omnitrophota bacterium]